VAGVMKSHYITHFLLSEWIDLRVELVLVHKDQADPYDMSDDVTKNDIVNRPERRQNFIDSFVSSPGAQVVHPYGTNQVRINLAQLK
jgi:hypothetical protein